jgi:hypothetical protein
LKSGAVARAWLLLLPLVMRRSCGFLVVLAMLAAGAANASGPRRDSVAYYRQQALAQARRGMFTGPGGSGEMLVRATNAAHGRKGGLRQVEATRERIQRMFTRSAEAAPARPQDQVTYYNRRALAQAREGRFFNEDSATENWQLAHDAAGPDQTWAVARTHRRIKALIQEAFRRVGDVPWTARDARELGLTNRK